MKTWWRGDFFLDSSWFRVSIEDASDLSFAPPAFLVRGEPQKFYSESRPGRLNKPPWLTDSRFALCSRHTGYRTPMRLAALDD